jgi:chemotaxis protein methyltransferase CheR
MPLARRSDDLAVAEGEFAFTWSDFSALAALVEAEAGIVLSESKAGLVYSRLSKRLRQLGLPAFRDYCELVEGDAGERQALIAAMTTNVTRFFREAHHFAHLESQVLPPLVAAARGGARVRLWSAACSSGEEPFSIALTLLAAMPDAPRHDILILATDIDPNMVAAGRAAVYPAARLADIPESRRQGLVERSGEEFRFAETVRSLVRFRPLNLLRDWPMRGRFDAVFCRNVMIYFDQATQDGLWARFADAMPPGAHLYIGHSERIAAGRLPFTLVAQTAYRRTA